MLMNGDFTLKQAEHLAKRLRTESPGELDHDLTRQFEIRFPRHQGAWQYGYGSVVESSAGESPTSVATRFQPLTYWTGSSWQGGTSMPDATVGWAFLTAAGGHPGDDQQRAVIRRWTSSKPGIISVTGALRHLSENGDGVRSRIISNRTGLVAEWTSKNNRVETNIAKVEVQPGENLDFVTDCLEHVTSDSFEWIVGLQLTDAAGVEFDRWDSASNFHGPQVTTAPQQIACAWRLAYCRPITVDEMDLACRFLEQQMHALKETNAKGDHELIALSSLCQQILSSNEFLYLD
jgi:hypothetical protein